MREVEFLPAWYPQARRRRCMVMAQAWVTVLVIVACALWVMRATGDIRRQETLLHTREAELSASRKELKVVEELMSLRRKLVEQSKVLSKVGSHAEAARLLATLDELMPRSAAVLELSLVTEEKQPITLAGARDAQAKERSVDRRLNVRVTGVAPTDVEVAEFLTRLTSKPFFEDVRMTGSKPRPDSGRIMREFEVFFSMNLNDPSGA